MDSIKLELSNVHAFDTTGVTLDDWYRWNNRVRRKAKRGERGWIIESEGKGQSLSELNYGEHGSSINRKTIYPLIRIVSPFYFQTEIAKRLNAIIAQILPFLSQEHQQQVATAVDRAKQVTMTELNAIIGVSARQWKINYPLVIHGRVYHDTRLHAYTMYTFVSLLGHMKISGNMEFQMGECSEPSVIAQNWYPNW